MRSLMQPRSSDGDYGTCCDVWVRTGAATVLSVSSGGAALNIPVELIGNGLVFVNAKVNGHAGWFILDNASQGFTVDRSFAGQIALPSSGSVAARGGGSDRVDAGVVRDVEIGLPGMVLTHRNLVVIDLKPLEPSVGHEVDGIIGSRLFDDFVVVVDYEHRSVQSTDPFSTSPLQRDGDPRPHRRTWVPEP